ncbi:MAG: hypothetical protein D6741_08230, partial [Planctomycetota bacterium]
MGKVTDELLRLVNKQLDDHGIVVWYDPERAYTQVVKQLADAGTDVHSLDKSLFELRHRLESALEFVAEDGTLRADCEAPPRVLVYLPVNRGDTHHALVEVESAGVVMEPGANHWHRNTRLKVITERVFKEIAPDRAAEVAGKIEEGYYDLDDVDQLADQTGDVGALKLVFDSTSFDEIALKFLASEEKYDAALQQKNALDELCRLFATELGLTISANQPVSEIRHELCRKLLLAELAVTAETHQAGLAALAGCEIPSADHQQKQLLDLCRHWRNRLDLRDRYVQWAERIEDDARLQGVGLSGDWLLEVETFPCVESLLLEWTETLVLDGDVA